MKTQTTIIRITGAGMHIFLFESSPVFAMPSIPVPTNSALVIYILLGLLIGIIATFVSRSVYAVEDLFEKLPIHWMWWPAIGAVVIGVTGFFAPRTMGVGYDNIQDLLKGNLPLTMLLSLCFLKYISWAISLGSGTSGGTLAPLFTIGGALGVLLGSLTLHAFPSLGINLPTAALIGMAAMFAGASRAFLTSVLFALETTGQINGLLPLLGACSAAYFVSFFFMKGSIMTEKIIRRGVKTPDAYEPDVLQGANVEELITEIPTGITNLPYVYKTDDAGLAAEMLGKYNLDTLLVLDNKANMQPVGVITSTAILKYYSDQKLKEHSYESPKRTQKIMVHGRKLMKKMGKQ